MDIEFILYLFAVQINQKNKVVKTDLFSTTANVSVTLPEFFHAHSVAGIQNNEKDEPPVIVVPPNK